MGASNPDPADQEKPLSEVLLPYAERYIKAYKTDDKAALEKIRDEVFGLTKVRGVVPAGLTKEEQEDPQILADHMSFIVQAVPDLPKWCVAEGYPVYPQKGELCSIPQAELQVAVATAAENPKSKDEVFRFVLEKAEGAAGTGLTGHGGLDEEFATRAEARTHLEAHVPSEAWQHARIYKGQPRGVEENPLSRDENPKHGYTGSEELRAAIEAEKLLAGVVGQGPDQRERVVSTMRDAWKTIVGFWPNSSYRVRFVNQYGDMLKDLRTRGVITTEDAVKLHPLWISTSKNPLGAYAIARLLMNANATAWGAAKAQSAKDFEKDDEAQKRYVLALEQVFPSGPYVGTLPNEVFGTLEDGNYHTLDEYLVRQAMFEDMTEFDDPAKSYSYRRWIKNRDETGQATRLGQFYGKSRPDWYERFGKEHAVRVKAAEENPRRVWRLYLPPEIYGGHEQRNRDYAVGAYITLTDDEQQEFIQRFRESWSYLHMRKQDISDEIRRSVKEEVGRFKQPQHSPSAAENPWDRRSEDTWETYYNDGSFAMIEVTRADYGSTYQWTAWNASNTDTRSGQAYSLPDAKREAGEVTRTMRRGKANPHRLGQWRQMGTKRFIMGGFGEDEYYATVDQSETQVYWYWKLMRTENDEVVASGTARAQKRAKDAVIAEAKQLKISTPISGMNPGPAGKYEWIYYPGAIPGDAIEELVPLGGAPGEGIAGVVERDEGGLVAVIIGPDGEPQDIGNFQYTEDAKQAIEKWLKVKVVGTNPGSELLANLGDQGDPVVYGGFFIYKVDSGHQGEYWEGSESDDEDNKVYVFDIAGDAVEDLDWVDEGEWKQIADSFGIPVSDLVQMGRSEDVRERAQLYREVGLWYGFDNLDSYPETYSELHMEQTYGEEWKTFQAAQRLGLSENPRPTVDAATKDRLARVAGSEETFELHDLNVRALPSITQVIEDNLMFLLTRERLLPRGGIVVLPPDANHTIGKDGRWKVWGEFEILVGDQTIGVGGVFAWATPDDHNLLYLTKVEATIKEVFDVEDNPKTIHDITRKIAWALSSAAAEVQSGRPVEAKEWYMRAHGLLDSLTKDEQDEFFVANKSLHILLFRPPDTWTGDDIRLGRGEANMLLGRTRTNPPKGKKATHALQKIHRMAASHSERIESGWRPTHDAAGEAFAEIAETAGKASGGNPLLLRGGSDAEQQLHLRQYLTTALWTDMDEEGRPLDQNHNIEEFAPEAIQKAQRDLAKFFRLANMERLLEDLPEGGEEQVAHDFWLTRNHHGAGFWDRAELYGEHEAKRLTEISGYFGETDVVIGDDGRLYLEGGKENPLIRAGDEQPVTVETTDPAEVFDAVTKGGFAFVRVKEEYEIWNASKQEWHHYPANAVSMSLDRTPNLSIADDGTLEFDGFFPETMVTPGSALEVVREISIEEAERRARESFMGGPPPGKVVRVRMRIPAKEFEDASIEIGTVKGMRPKIEWPKGKRETGQNPRRVTMKQINAKIEDEWNQDSDEGREEKLQVAGFDANRAKTLSTLAWNDLSGKMSMEESGRLWYEMFQFLREHFESRGTLPPNLRSVDNPQTGIKVRYFTSGYAPGMVQAIPVSDRYAEAFLRAAKAGGYDGEEDTVLLSEDDAQETLSAKQLATLRRVGEVVILQDPWEVATMYGYDAADHYQEYLRSEENPEETWWVAYYRTSPLAKWRRLDYHVTSEQARTQAEWEAEHHKVAKSNDPTRRGERFEYEIRRWDGDAKDIPMSVGATQMRAWFAGAPLENPRTRKGTYYFSTFQEARAFAQERRLPTDRIIPYELGWAIQREISGPYFGPSGWAANPRGKPLQWTESGEWEEKKYRTSRGGYSAVVSLSGYGWGWLVRRGGQHIRDEGPFNTDDQARKDVEKYFKELLVGSQENPVDGDVGAAILFGELIGHDSERWIGPIYPDNVAGLIRVDELKVPFSELAMHTRAAGKQISAWAISRDGRAAIALWQKDECNFNFTEGLAGEVLPRRLIELSGKMFGVGSNPKDATTIVEAMVEAIDEASEAGVAWKAHNRHGIAQGYWESLSFEEQEGFEAGFPALAAYAKNDTWFETEGEDLHIRNDVQNELDRFASEGFTFIRSKKKKGK